ncbi:hypothetical protein [Ruania rhizosphaerae]|uniref:hypothetical protein n=1 Tax=Ruania rhizosphaerae TaxID=1840413 RepID=UPI001F486D7D|nr:hypothetical protein [Ruania rhizosphaerae]
MKGNSRARRTIAAVVTGVGLLLAAPVAAGASTLSSDAPVTAGGFTIQGGGNGADEEVI